MIDSPLVKKAQTDTQTGLKQDEAIRKQIRGSGLLLSGRFISLALNFLAQIIIVRHLSTSDYGAWAYALSVIALFQSFASLGMERSIARFVPIYHEKRSYDRLFGTIILVLASIVVISAIFIGTFYLIGEKLPGLITQSREPLILLFILIFLVPLEAADRVLTGLFASFSSARSIFFRKHVLGPGLKLLAVVLLVWSGSNITFLAYGYVAATLLVIVIYSWLLLRMLHRKRLLEKFDAGTLKYPVAELAAFTLPLLLGDLLATITFSASSVMLGYFFGTVEVAFFRVVLPAATLNRMVMPSFVMLYTPTAARLFARGDFDGINRLYWQTSVWMCALSFPVFAATFCLSTPLTVLFYGARYEQSGLILAILALGHFFDVALGFNDLTIRVLGKYRYIVIINLVCTAANIMVNLALIPRYGALGAAIGTTGSVIVQNILKQFGLRQLSGINAFDKTYISFYAVVTAATLVLFLARMMSSSHVYLAALLAALASVAVIVMTRDRLKIRETFPESLRLPFLKKLLA